MSKTVEERLTDLEKKVAALEGKVQEQHTVDVKELAKDIYCVSKAYNQAEKFVPEDSNGPCKNVKENTVAPEGQSQEQNKILIVSVILSNSVYYLTDLEFSISKNIRDSILILSKDAAYKLATKVENNYSNSLGRVLEIDLSQLY